MPPTRTPSGKSASFRLGLSTEAMLGSLPTGQGTRTAVAVPSDRELLDAVHRLEPQQQECVTLRFLQGLPVAQTAKIMGRTVSAIKRLQYRAVRTLARMVDGIASAEAAPQL
ncbi:sigma-70 family RNA polymerase sigma factor [Streptomyces sp. CB01881]|uniref:sigma-70 family RNA polymerase sigma factor n=1 Tax=Streptomyces sp. CB01881 TaxID=2078691 RepID=UPI000CDC998A|nr:sigma-70 family RNA polymerase sigma factor [Streptomyces sp. CB01881]AUY47669.1 hypothetical protein C2142_00295 [Streptomyces sp. CB01881]TYC76142.1 hypothetical protein EH183_00295 [Streptomyces sp. CB01881]